jgi:serine/threonine protein kinase
MTQTDGCVWCCCVQRDLKPENLLLTDDRDEGLRSAGHIDSSEKAREHWRLLISDFGESRVKGKLLERTGLLLLPSAVPLQCSAFTPLIQTCDVM